MNRIVPALAVAALAFTASVVRADDWSKTYQIANHANFELRTDNGDVTIHSSDAKQISARVTTTGYKISPDEVRIEESQSGDHVIVTVKTPHMHFGLFGGVHHDIHVVATVPRDLDMKVDTGNGPVNVDSASGHLQINTGNGAIHVAALRGDISLHSGNGGMDGNNLDGNLEVSSGNGGIRISGRFDRLAMNTGNGGLEATAISGSHLGAPWSIHSGNGAVTLHIPSDLDALVNLETGNGGITVDMPVTVQGSVGRSHLRGNLNHGGPELKITSGDGSIHLMPS